MTDTLSHKRLLQRYSRALITTPLNTASILEMLLKQASQALAPERALVFWRNPTAGAFTVVQSWPEDMVPANDSRFGLSNDLAKWLGDTGDILQLDGEGRSPREVTLADEELGLLNALSVALCIPLSGSEHLLGWLALGPRSGDDGYSADDLVFLSTLASQTTIALENAQLLEEANRRAAELEALQKISAGIQAEAEPDKLLKSVVEQAMKLLNAEGGLVYLLEPDGRTLRCLVSHDLDHDYTGYTLKYGEGVAGRVLALGESVAVDDYHKFSGRSKQFEEARLGAVLGAPLRWGGKVQGVLCLVHGPNGQKFRKGDIWLIELFATQSAIALRKAQLLQEAHKKAHQLATLSEISSAISSTLDLHTVLNRIMSYAVELLGAEAGSLLLVGHQDQDLTFEVVLGPTGQELLGKSTQVGKGIVGTVAQTGEPLIINDVAGDPRWDVAFDQATQFKTRDLLCVPMSVRNMVIGVIELVNKQDGTGFSEEDCNLLLSFAGQAAIAIQNAQQFTRTDQALGVRVQELQTLHAFDQELQTSLELKPVLDIILTHAMDALGVSIGLLGIVQERGGRTGLYLLSQRGMPIEMSRYREEIPWPLDKGLIGQVVRTGLPALVNNVDETPDYIPKVQRTKSVLVVPIPRDDKVVGVLNLESPNLNYFTSDDVSFLSLLISHAAIAISNAQLFEQVKQANDSKSEFMSTASHELKIPMTSIKGYAKLLQMGAVGAMTEKQQEFLNIITNNVDRMNRLVSDLLDVSRIEAGRIRLEIGEVQISDVIHEVFESVQTQIEAKKQQLTIEMDGNLPVVRADYNRMVQIVANLVSNAYKYTPEGGRISVTAKPNSHGEGDNSQVQSIVVTVRDTGYGISEEDRAKLFTNFFRSSDQEIRSEPGTGLGLSITKRMIETHGGELIVESEYGQGSAFTFTVPLISKVPPGVEVVERS
jgi:signal transduction histidine kinase